MQVDSAGYEDAAGVFAIVDGNNSYDMAPPGQRSAALKGRTNDGQTTRVDSAGAGVLPVQVNSAGYEIAACTSITPAVYE